MISKNILSIIIIGIGLKCFSQTDIKDDYVLLLNRDTVFGKICNNGFYKNSQYCEILDNKTNKAIIYNPNQIIEYKFSGGKYYISKEIEINGIKTKLFLEYLIDGKLDVYFVLDLKGEDHYFVSKDSINFYELFYYKGIREEQGKQIYYEKKKFVGVLDYLTYDCPEIKNDIQRFNSLNHDNLISFAKKYSELTCKDGQCVIYSKKIPRKILIFACSGLLKNYTGNYYFQDNDKIKAIYGFDILFQQGQRHEKMFFGVGFYKFFDINGGLLLNGYQIPFSINYLNSNKLISPLFSYEFDVNMLMLQGIKLGVLFNTKKVSLGLMTNFKTVNFINAFGSSINFMVSYNIN